MNGVTVTYPEWGGVIFMFGFALAVRFFHWNFDLESLLLSLDIYVDQYEDRMSEKLYLRKIQ